MIMKTNYTYIALLVLSGIIGSSIGGSIGSSNSINETLVLCNQRPHECKFKYDILMYEKDGRVPYVDPTQPKTTEKK